MKLLIDRMRLFIAGGQMRGGRAAVAAPAEEGADACKALVGNAWMGRTIRRKV